MQAVLQVLSAWSPQVRLHVRVRHPAHWRVLWGTPRSPLSLQLVGLPHLWSLSLRHGERVRCQLQQDQRRMYLRGNLRFIFKLFIFLLTAMQIYCRNNLIEGSSSFIYLKYNHYIFNQELRQIIKLKKCIRENCI